MIITLNPGNVSSKPKLWLDEDIELVENAYEHGRLTYGGIDIENEGALRLVKSSFTEAELSKAALEVEMKLHGVEKVAVNSVEMVTIIQDIPMGRTIPTIELLYVNGVDILSGDTMDPGMNNIGVIGLRMAALFKVVGKRMVVPREYIIEKNDGNKKFTSKLALKCAREYVDEHNGKITYE